MPSNRPLFIVAIDGGAASGKSSTSRALCRRFNFLHVDTGSHYRALTAALLAENTGPEDTARVVAALARLPVGTAVSGNEARITVAGRVIPDAELRAPAVNAAVSGFAAIPELRAALLAYQRGQAAVAEERGFHGLIMEGRDIGSVIFPGAQLRVFLHADPEARARRRALEGQSDSIAERDRRDSTRTTAPLVCPDGAVSIDSTRLTLDEVVGKIAALIGEGMTAR
ncbi:MAG: (d)CMP kinase [Opitutaceae bacterium]|nr:(d)CMP kinase [Opitutaceae bacterium]